MISRRETQLNCADESGYALVAFVALLVPLIGIAAAAMMTMGSRTDRLGAEIRNERALLAAEAGFDSGIYGLNTGALSHATTYQRTLPGGASFALAVDNLRLDGIDNDGDGKIDEHNEDVYQLVVRGVHGWGVRRIAAYVSPDSAMPKAESALALQSTGTDVALLGSSLIDGRDHELDGSLGNPSLDVEGLSIATPGTVAHLNTIVTGAEEAKVTGAGGTPSLGVAASTDVNALVAQLLPLVDNTLTGTVYTDYIYGDASLGTAMISYRNGDVKFAGNSRGAGVLIVSGDLEMDGNSRFDGIIIVLGELKLTGSGPRVFGSVMMGPASPRVRIVGGGQIVFSQIAVEIAEHESRFGGYKARGWQELSRN